MPPEPDLVRLFHIWEAAREAMGHTEGRSRKDLDADRLLQHALVRLLEIIGEAAAGSSTAFRSTHPQVPWKAMVGMRNRLVHAYFDVDLDVVWRTIREDLPNLCRTIEPVLDSAGML